MYGIGLLIGLLSSAILRSADVGYDTWQFWGVAGMIILTLLYGIFIGKVLLK